MADWSNRQGWDQTDKEMSSQGNTYSRLKRFWMRAGDVKRVLFLDQDPFNIWEHNLQINGKYGNFRLCERRNGIANECSVEDCQGDRYPSLTGYFTVICLDEFTLDDRKTGKPVTIRWTKRLYGARAGSKAKPGILHKIRRISEKRDGIAGCIFDIERSGDQTSNVGDEFEFVSKILPDPHHGLELAVKQWAFSNKGVTQQEWDRNPWTPYEYGKVFDPSYVPPKPERGGHEERDTSQAPESKDEGASDIDDMIPF